MTGVYIKDYGCTLKIFKHEIAEDLGLYGELHRFIPVLAKQQGASSDQRHSELARPDQCRLTPLRIPGAVGFRLSIACCRDC